MNKTLFIKHIFIIYLIIFLVNGDDILNRSKRYLIYPYGGSYKLVIGFGIPVMLSKHQSLSVAHNVQFQYPVITNISEIAQGYPPIINRRRRFSEEINEWKLIYKAFETILNRYGINGKSCLLRSICENASFSLNHNANGLYGELLHIFLTPNHGSNLDEFYDENEYMDALKAGKYGIDCFSQFSDCPQGHGLLDIITTLE